MDGEPCVWGKPVLLPNRAQYFHNTDVLNAVFSLRDTQEERRDVRHCTMAETGGVELPSMTAAHAYVLPYHNPHGVGTMKIKSRQASWPSNELAELSVERAPNYLPSESAAELADPDRRGTIATVWT